MNRNSYQMRAEYYKKAVAKRRRILKQKAVEMLGGKCLRCGYDRYIGALEFHHMQKKSFGLSKDGISRSWDKVESEVRKCVLLCSNCHRELHGGLVNVDDFIDK